MDEDRFGFAWLKMCAAIKKNNFINDVMGELQKNLSERFKMASERLKKFRGTFAKTALFNRIMTHSPSPSTLPKRRIFEKAGAELARNWVDCGAFWGGYNWFKMGVEM
jgi:hypothetical protein